MTKMTRFLAPFLIAICAAACGARSSRPTLPSATRDAVVSDFLHGESLDQIGSELRIDRETARDTVHDAMISLAQHYYHRDR